MDQEESSGGCEGGEMHFEMIGKVEVEIVDQGPGEDFPKTLKTMTRLSLVV